MDPSSQHYSCLRKVLLLYQLLLLFITPTLISSLSTPAHDLSTIRKLLEDNDQGVIITKNKATSKIPSRNQTQLNKPSPPSSKNQTKLNTTGFKDQTKLIKSQPSDPAKNKTKLIKATSDHSPAQTTKSQIKKLNSTSNSTTKLRPTPAKPSPDPSKLSSFKNTTNKPKPNTNKESKAQSHKTVGEPKSKGPNKAQRQTPQQIQIDRDDEDEDDDDLISEFKDLPYRFQETFVPDLERISKESRIYLTSYHDGIAKGFKPYVGNRYAATIAPIASFAFIIIPLILVSIVFNRITDYVSLQKILIFVQFYLAAYFAILGLSSLVTGVEALRFFYSASQSTYVCVQVLQTLAYGLYVLLLLAYLILAFSPEAGLGSKLLGLGQALVGLTVGLHYYVTVFHRAVLHQPPKSGWKVQFMYATCYLVIGLLGTVGRRKKAYLAAGGEEGKQS